MILMVSGWCYLEVCLVSIMLPALPDALGVQVEILAGQGDPLLPRCSGEQLGCVKPVVTVLLTLCHIYRPLS